MRPRWLLVQEWKQQYEVREVNLDVAVGKDVDVLIAPQPSRLNNKQLLRTSIIISGKGARR